MGRALVSFRNNNPLLHHHLPFLTLAVLALFGVIFWRSPPLDFLLANRLLSRDPKPYRTVKHSVLLTVDSNQAPSALVAVDMSLISIFS